MKRCPECDSPLFRRRAEGIEVDGCAGCGGVWLDRGELRSLAEAGAGPLRAVDAMFRDGMQPVVARQRTDQCPVCRVALVASPYPGIAGLSVRGCGQCGGVFLEDGQLARVADHFGQPQAASAPRAAPAASVASPLVAPSPSHAPSSPAGHDETSTAHLPVVVGTSLPRIDHAGGFFNRLTRGWAFIKNAYALGWSKKSLMLPVLLGGAAGFVFIALNIGLFFALAGTNESSIELWFREHGALATVWGFLFLFGQHLINYAAMGMCVNMVDAYLKGLTPRLSTAVRDVAKNLGAIVTLAIVGTLVELIVSSLRNRRRRGLGSFLYGSVAGLVESFWTVASFLMLPVIMIEDVGLGTSLSRARSLHGGNLMQIAVGEVGINLVQGLIGSLVGLLLFALGVALVPTGVGGVVILVLVAGVVVVCLGTLNVFTKAAYYTSLYLWTVETERAGVGAATVPGPLARVFA